MSRPVRSAIKTSGSVEITKFKKRVNFIVQKMPEGEDICSTESSQDASLAGIVTRTISERKYISFIGKIHSLNLPDGMYILGLDKDFLDDGYTRATIMNDGNDKEKIAEIAFDPVDFSKKTLYNGSKIKLILTNVPFSVNVLESGTTNPIHKLALSGDIHIHNDEIADSTRILTAIFHTQASGIVLSSKTFNSLQYMGDLLSRTNKIPHGHGTVTFKNGATVSGTWKKGELQNGIYQYTDESGRVITIKVALKNGEDIKAIRSVEIAKDGRKTTFLPMVNLIDLPIRLTTGKIVIPITGSQFRGEDTRVKLSEAGIVPAKGKTWEDVMDWSGS